MKKYCVLFLTFFLKLNFHAQAYQPFDSTTVWNTVRTSVATVNNCYRDDLYSFFVQGFLVNNGVTWHRVYANVEEEGFYDRFTFLPCNITASSVITTTFVGLVSNDSVAKKVYFIPSATLSPNYVRNPGNILFDFNKSIGDTIWAYNSGSPSTPIFSLGYRITAIDSILFDYEYHKRFIGSNVTSIYYSPSIAYFIEGIGSTVGVFNAAFNIFGPLYTPLVCFSGVSNSKYFPEVYPSIGIPNGIRDTTSCSWLATAIPEIKHFQNSEIKIYPNPAGKTIQVKFTTASNSDIIACISDLSGRELKSISLDPSKLNQAMDLVDLSDGVYLITLFENGRIVYTTKLIKQES